MPRTVHLIRHAQSTFNAAEPKVNGDPLHFDARLSPLGLRQVEEARTRARALPCDVVFTTPLTRALQTADGLFGGHAPIKVEPLHREHQEDSCDMGRSPHMLAAEFPHLAFDHLEDPWWHHGEANHLGVIVEPMESFHGRVARFRDWLKARPEDAVVVVGHSVFFRHLTGHSFANCEILAWQP